MPLAGSSPTFTAILISACRPNSMMSPAVAWRMKPSGSCAALDRPRSTMKANSASRIRQAMSPYSSATTAKIKSVWESGSTSFTVPSPGPRPSQPPCRKESSARSAW